MSEIRVRKLYNASYHQECHFIGLFTAVCWNCEVTYTKKGTTETATYTRRGSAPYINWIQIWDCDNPFDLEDGSEFERSEDSPVEGGLQLPWAKDVLDELTTAVAYMEQQS